MFAAKPHAHLVPFDGSFDRAAQSTTPPEDSSDKKKLKKGLEKRVETLADLQKQFYAHDKNALLLIFQAMDAAGKDSTIRAVMTGINPAGCEVYSFKKPSALELDHDFLWRTGMRLPERGRIGIFNRSYYEEVLVVRVHPELLEYQRLPDQPDLDVLWQQRFESIQDLERHLARNGTVILKFWLNVSKEEQRQRFLARLNDPEKNWKFAPGDVAERAYWDDYMHAYEQMLRATSRPWAPWYAIPADDKPYMRFAVADILVTTMEHLKFDYPKISDAEQAVFTEMRNMLATE
jgi:PPK2 family polyphosphate:nucleotide phosphotransferase